MSCRSACNKLNDRLLAGDACCQAQQASPFKLLIVSDILADKKC